MLILLSPAKKLDLENEFKLKKTSFPDFLDKTKILAQILKEKTPKDLKELMKISDNIAELNYNRYQDFNLSNVEKLYVAISSFAGEVYNGLDAKTLSNNELEYANNNLRILSGLYGLLRPFDQIQPYRLEMGTKLENPEGKNLYDFWQSLITEKINNDFSTQIINLASNEYFKAVKFKSLKQDIITPAFFENKNGEYKTIMMYAKKARGLMARYIIKNKIKNWEALKFFNYDNYIFNARLSDLDCKNKKLVFTRG